MTFEQAFLRAQNVLGLNHYEVGFSADAKALVYAEIDIDPPSCTASVSYNEDQLLEQDHITSAACHEAVHLLVADLKYALINCPTVADMEEERLARRLEPILRRLICDESI